MFITFCNLKSNIRFDRFHAYDRSLGWLDLNSKLLQRFVRFPDPRLSRTTLFFCRIPLNVFEPLTQIIPFTTQFFDPFV